MVGLNLSETEALVKARLPGWEFTKTGYRYSVEYLPWLNKQWIQSLLKIAPNETFLDVGCYQGLFVIEAAMKGQYAIGLDTLENRVREGKIQAKKVSRFRKFGLYCW